MRSSRHGDRRAVVEERGHPRRVERRRHHHQAKVVARAPRLPGQGEAQVAVDAALVELVEHDRVKVREQRVLLQARGEDAFRGDEQPGLADELTLEADVPPDFAPRRPALLGGDAPRNGSRGDASRLEQDEPAVTDECRRHTRRLTGARRGSDDSPRASPAARHGSPQHARRSAAILVQPAHLSNLTTAATANLPQPDETAATAGTLTFLPAIVRGAARGTFGIGDWRLMIADWISRIARNPHR